MITKVDLSNIVKSFATTGVVFSNEQDFQFALAAKIKSLPGIKKVYFESLSLSISFSTVESQVKKLGKNYKLPKDKKQYHDLLIEQDDGTYVVLELKYKTPEKICVYETKADKFITLAQGDYHIAAYDFLNDVYRLENIKTRFFQNDIQLKISKCYCIFLTNDKNYRFNDFSGSSIWENYTLCAGKITPAKAPLLFYCGMASPSLIYSPKSKTFTAITLSKSYAHNWEDYPLCDVYGNPYNDYEDKMKSYHPGFSFLIFEI